MVRPSLITEMISARTYLICRKVHAEPRKEIQMTESDRITNVNMVAHEVVEMRRVEVGRYSVVKGIP